MQPCPSFLHEIAGDHILKRLSKSSQLFQAAFHYVVGPRVQLAVGKLAVSDSLQVDSCWSQLCGWHEGLYAAPVLRPSIPR